MFLDKKCVLVLLNVAMFIVVDGLPEEIPIGCLLNTVIEDDISGLQEKAFRHAVDLVNEKKVLTNTALKALSQKIKPYDSFQVGTKACDILGKGVAGIFGPQSSLSSDHIQSICDAMEIPHVEMRFDSQQRRGSCLVNLYPHPSQLSKVFKDLVKMNEWKSFTVIYEDNDGLLRLNNLLKYYDKKGYPVTVRQLDPGENNRPLMRRIKGAGEKNIVLDCKTERLYSVLEQALQVGLMGDDINYIITDLDMHTVNLEPFMHGGTNITGIRMIDPEDEDVKSLLENWRECPKHSNDIDDCEPVIPEDTALQLETALIFDAVGLFAEALRHLEEKQIDVKSLNCSDEQSWDHGYSIINYMKVSELKGLTGIIKFDHQGFRTNFKLDIIELTRDGLKKKGTWNTTEGVNLTAMTNGAETGIIDKPDLRNMTFTVLIALTHPYGMLKQASHKLTGNDRFEGFGIDLIHELSLKCGFNYTFQIQADGSSGNPNPKTGKWSGMIGEVLAGRADLAIADITITRERERDADFTMPFMNLGISILYKKPMKAPPELFSFLSPFSGEVWIYVIASYIGVSLLLFCMARISPNEWTNPYPCIDDDNLDALENQFSLNNSFWFTTGSVLQQGSEIAPIAVSTRMAAGIWWFFTLIMVSSYTANLAAFLTIESTISAFRSVEELANHKTIKFGAKKGGATSNFFRDSNHSTYQRMWEYMNAQPEVMTKSNNEGVERVINEDYAFLMESTSIEYEVERKCELTQVGGLLDSKGYGIVMRKNMWYRNQLSTSVISLQETGKLTKLKNKWWKEKRGGGKCQKTDDSGGGADELGLQNVGGVFVVLVAGVGVACFVAFGELLYSVYTKEERGPLKEELWNELKFIIQCSGSTKPLKPQEDEEETNEITSDMAPFTPYKSFDSETKQPL